MIHFFRNKRSASAFSLLTMLGFFVQLFAPIEAFGLTTGPSAPEVSSFTPIDQSNLVNLSTGSFSYNIPLMDIDGYPINISYDASVTMDQEASWVGLGWNLNPGAVNRNMRGLPDDFKGDKVIKELSTEKNETYGLRIGAGLELFGLEGLGVELSQSLGIFYNNYKGLGHEIATNVGLSMTKSADVKGKTSTTRETKIGGGLSLNYNSFSGLDISPSVSFSRSTKDKSNADNSIMSSASLSASTSFNSRNGLGPLTLGGNLSKSSEYKVSGREGTFSNGSSISGSSSYSFASPSYVPTSQHSYKNFAFAYSANAGGELFGLAPALSSGGYYSKQSIEPEQKVLKKPAYGYLYAQENDVPNEALQDINRDGEGTFTLGSTPYLAVPQMTHDVFNVSAQGLQGQFRPFRSDIGINHDPSVSSSSGDGQAGVDVGAGNTIKVGANVTYTTMTNDAGAWKFNNQLDPNLLFRKAEEINGTKEVQSLYEPAYFKQAGEKMVMESELFEKIGGYQPVWVKLQKRSKDIIANDRFKSTGGDLKINSVTPRPTNDLYLSKRAKRNTSFSYLTGLHREGCLTLDLKDYSIANHPSFEGAPGFSNVSNISRFDNNPTDPDKEIRKRHHITEVSVLRPDGQRFVFGVPAYNYKQKEVTLNVSGESPTGCGEYQVKYDLSDNGDGNNNGLDNYYQAQELPPYAYSYLLSAVLGADYVDSDNVEGPSTGDIGTWHKINYSRIHQNYYWRTPVGEQMANFNRVLQQDEDDDKGSYSYGSKEIWNVHSIESRTSVAEFYTSAREDGVGVTSENEGRDGGIVPDPQDSDPSARLMKLDSIRLFSKAERLSQGANAVPLKTIIFSYDYSLCPNTPNSCLLTPPYTCGQAANGKLTLTKVQFKHGKSRKAMLAPYSFEYELTPGNGDHENPRYNTKFQDRWGTYKEVNCGTDLPVYEFPYAEQDRTEADLEAAAWLLKKITTPSGSQLTVSYESNDYAYVQDRKAHQMFRVLGTGDSPSETNYKDELYNNNLPFKADHYNYVFFDVPTSQLGITSQEFQQRFIEGLTTPESGGNPELYFSFNMDITRNGHPEQVTGVCQIEESGVSTNSSGQTVGWVKLKEAKIRHGKTVPSITKNAMNFAKIHLPRLLNPGGTSGSGTARIILSLTGYARELANIFAGPFNILKTGGFCRTFDPASSWIRLIQPDQKKLGGGARVKQIVHTDEWKSMVDRVSSNNSGYASAHSYTQKFDYTTEENGRVISSGVAAFEPMLGGDENPFFGPYSYSEEKAMVPNDEFRKPYPGLNYYPSPGIVYSKVTVSNELPANISRHGNGKTVHEFYTSRDFPVIIKRSDVEPYHKKPNGFPMVQQFNSVEKVGATQGFYIYKNDMHGKPKAQWVYASDLPKPISGLEYVYRTTPNGLRLNNEEVPIILKDGTISTGQIGVEFDLVVDMKSQVNETVSIKGAANVDIVGTPPPIFIPFPSLWFTPSYIHSSFYSASVAKVVNIYGLVDKVVAYDNGSIVSTENLAYDAETGEVLLTRTSNEYEDPLYSLSYPAHWAYPEMGQAYQNVGAHLKGNIDPDDLNANSLGVTQAEKLFFPGDMVLVRNSFGWQKGHVLAASGTSVNIIDKNAVPIPGNYNEVLVIKSGRKNQQAISIGSVVSKTNPLTSGFDNIADVVSATATTYSENSQADCDCIPNSPNFGDEVNPYQLGIRGNWYPLATYAYMSDRAPTVSPYTNPILRKDGVYTNGTTSTFNPFWLKGTPWNPNPGSWLNTEEVTRHSALWGPFETIDALERYKSTLFGYDNTLPVATSYNCEYREQLYLNFEDFDPNSCKNHGNLSAITTMPNGNPYSRSEVAEGVAHSGNKSWRVFIGEDRLNQGGGSGSVTLKTELLKL
ncbi:MAG: hypothetical protein AAGI38_04060, partial [Bacteroidota bacterium]